MKDNVINMVATMNTYEKQELLKELTNELCTNHNHMLSNLENIDGYVFGMINNSEHNKLNELTMRQLDNIKKLSKIGETIK